MNVTEARVFGTSTLRIWCYRCGEMKPFSEYENLRGEVVHTKCRACRTEERREARRRKVD